MFDAQLSDGSPGTPSITVRILPTGAGLPKADLRALFNPFLARENCAHESATLLLTCYFLVYHHGGRFVVDAGENNGSIYSITFPVDPSGAALEPGDRKFVSKVLENERLWERLLS